RATEDARVVALAAERDVDHRHEAGTVDAAQRGRGDVQAARADPVTRERIGLRTDEERTAAAPAREIEKRAVASQREVGLDRPWASGRAEMVAEEPCIRS